MSVVNNILRISKFFLYILSNIVPKKNNLWVFGASWGERYDGNPKFFFEYVLKNKDNEVQAVWISKNKEVVKELQNNDLPVYYRNSLYGIFLVFRAEIVFLSHNLSDVGWHGGGSTVVQLWHGDPLKKMGKDKDRDLSVLSKLADEWLTTWDYMFVGSKSAANIFSNAYSLDRDKVRVTGYPRNDIFTSNLDDCTPELNRNLIEIFESYYTIFYLPTWREGFGEEDGTTNTRRIKQIAESIDSDLIFFFVKFHPHEQTSDVTFEDVENTMVLPVETDIYPLLKHSDALITDYSSIMFDYLHHDQPIILYPYDLEEYENSRGFYYDYESIVPGPIVRSPDELLSILSDTGIEDKWKTERKETKERIGLAQGNSSERIFNTLYDG